MTARNFNLKAAHNYLSAAILQRVHNATLQEAHASLNQVVERMQEHLTHFEQRTFFKQGGFVQRFAEHSKAIERSMQSVRRRSAYIDHLVATKDIGRHYAKTRGGKALEGAWQALLAADAHALAQYLPYNQKALAIDEYEYFRELIKTPNLKLITNSFAGGREAHSSWAFAFDIGEADVNGIKLSYDLTPLPGGKSEGKTTISLFSGVIEANGKLTIQDEMTGKAEAFGIAMRAVARMVAEQHGGTVTGPLV